MKTLKQLYQEQNELKSLLEIKDKEIEERLKQTLVQCTSNNYGKECGMGHKIGELEYIQTHWYEEPHGCTGGDEWWEGEGQFICPHCNHRNRLYERPEIEELKYLFKSIKDEHER